MAKLKRFFIILLVVVLLVGFAVGLYFYFTRESPPIVGDKLALTMNDSVIENNASLGLLDSGQAFTVESSEKYNVQVFAYCTQENDFTLTVGDIIQLTFNRDGVYTVIPVVANPIDIVGAITPPVEFEGYKWWVWVLIALAVIIVLILLAPLLPMIIMFLIKLLGWIFKGLWWLISAPFKLIAKAVKKRGSGGNG